MKKKYNIIFWLGMFYLFFYNIESNICEKICEFILIALLKSKFKIYNKN